MQLPKELEEKIKTLFVDDAELRMRLLKGEAEAIQQLAMITGKIDPIEIVKSYENNTMDFLYQKAKKLIQIRDLYVELCYWNALQNVEKEREKQFMKQIKEH